jgi:hypothetical protein
VNVQRLSDLNKNRYWGVSESAKHEPETGITKNKMVDERRSDSLDSKTVCRSVGQEEYEGL